VKTRIQGYVIGLKEEKKEGKGREGLDPRPKGPRMTKG